MDTFFRILHLIKAYKASVLLHVVFGLLAVLFSLASLTMVIPFLGLLFDKQALVLQPPDFEWSVGWAAAFFNYKLSGIIHEYGKGRALLSVCLLVIAVFFLKNLFQYASLYFMAGIRNGVVRDLRNQLFGKLLRLPLSYLSETRRGDMVSRLTADVQEVEYGIMGVLGIVVREPFAIVSYLAAMLFISPRLTLFVFLILPVTGLLIGKIGKTLKRKSHQAQSRLGMLMSVVDETLSGLRVVRGFNAEAAMYGRFAGENEAHYKVTTSMLRRRDLSSPLTEFMSICVVGLVLYIGGEMVLEGESNLQAETFIGFMLIFSQIIPPAKAISTAYYYIQKGLASAERVFSVLDEPETVVNMQNALPATTFGGQITFKNVSFAYASEPVLENIELTINKGELLALVGASGAGKSTLADLLPRFYDPTQGSILLDGVDIKRYELTDLRRLMGIVTQQPILFNDTIYNNIVLGGGTTDMQAVVDAAKAAHAHHFIEKLPQGYQTAIGDNGCKLSGGERQRLTIARAILKNPPILILDEATSSLDSKSESLVQNALARLMENRTAIIIAHRLATVRHADRIVVLDKGRIVETGTHTGLMEQQGAYSKLVRLQEF